MSAIVWAALVLPGSAAADDPTFTASAAPEFSFPVAQLVYRLEIATGAEAERFYVSTTPDTLFPGAGGYFASVGEVALEGPGTSTISGIASGGAPFTCPPSNSLRVFHGLPFRSVTTTVELPPSSTSTLVVQAPVSSDAPWPGMEPRMNYRIGNPAAGGTLAGERQIVSPTPRNVGRSGVQIQLATDPPGRPVFNPGPAESFDPGPAGCEPSPVAPGTEVVVRGITSPPIAGQVLQLVQVPPGQSDALPLAEVSVDSSGAFAYRGWRPTVPGHYKVGALYQSQSPSLADDFAIPVTVLVGPGGGPPGDDATPPGDDEIATPAVRLSLGRDRTLRVSRRGVVRVRLACKAPGTTCAGALRLVGRVARRRRTLGRARFEVPAGRSRLVAVRIGRRGRSVLHRGRTLNVRAQTSASGGRTMGRLKLRLRGSRRR